MHTVVAIAGSLRTGSYNQALLRAVVSAAPKELRIQEASIRGIPLYDGDLERNEGIPAPVTALKDRIASADGLLLVTPEYNNSVPGVLKNAVDWLTRPPADIPRVFGDKPVGIMGASPGRFGTQLAQVAWLPVLRTLGTRPFFGTSLLVSAAGRVFDEAGDLADDDTRARLTRYLEGFARFIAE